jgi:cytochrome c peroxidase
LFKKPNKQIVIGQQTKISLFKPLLYLIAVISTTFISWLLIDDPEQMTIPTDIPNPKTFAQQVAEFSFNEGQLPLKFEGEEKKLASFGRELFFDTNLSSDGTVACATCHIPEQGFTDGRRFSHGIGVTGRNAPTIINSAAAHWFFWDGRSDSLASQALGPIEHPNEHGISRAFVANLIKKNYRKKYETFFGPWPQALKGKFPNNALPRPIKIEIPIEVTSYALQTIGIFSLLEEILEVSSKKRIAPAQELNSQLTANPPYDENWFNAWDKLSDEQRQAINQVYLNFGIAIETWERGIIASDSPFDSFAANLKSGLTSEKSLTKNFGQEELAGLRIFVGKGHCTNCHIGPMFSDQQFHNTGFKGLLGKGEAGLDIGRSAGILKILQDPFNCKSQYFTGSYFTEEIIADRKGKESCKELPWLSLDNKELVGAFKTPTLRNIAQTAPYGHDGRFATLNEILERYNKMDETAVFGHTEDSLVPLNLNSHEINALEKFMHSLTSEIKDLTTEKNVPQKR